MSVRQGKDFRTGCKAFQGSEEVLEQPHESKASARC